MFAKSNEGPNPKSISDEEGSPSPLEHAKQNTNRNTKPRVGKRPIHMMSDLLRDDNGLLEQWEHNGVGILEKAGACSI